MLHNQELGCDECVRTIKISAGWTFCKMFNNLFGNSILTLKGEGEHGEDIVFSATDEWLRLNSAMSRLGLACDPEGLDFSMKVMEHLKTCQSPCCVDAMHISLEISAFSEKGHFIGDKALYEVFDSDGRLNITLSRGNQCSEAIEMIKPFFLWFMGENRDLWVWPENELVGLANYNGQAN